MPHKEGVVILRDQAKQAAVGTLATGIAAVVSNTHATGLLNAFLMKKVKAKLWLDAPDAGDTLLVGIARGGATVTEIKTAIEDSTLDRDRKGQAQIRDVLFETIDVLAEMITATEEHLFVSMEVSVGGGNGIPFDEGEGWQWFMYNAGANDQVAGALINLDVTYWGAWLGN